LSAIDFEKVYHDNFKIVYGYIYSTCKDSHIAEEITQETFFKALKNIDKFQGRSKESVWLCEIAKNTYYTYCKKNRKLTDKDEIVNQSITEDSTLEHFIDSEDIDRIHKILHEIEEPYKEVFSLRVFGELPYQKVGELFHKSESWARVTYYRAKQKIINRMEEK
jgi:RNA polymerase sigma-70 factor (ECF subfamily)